MGQRLEALRKARGLTQFQIAQALGTTQRTVSYYETQGGSPPAHVVVALDALDPALGASTCAALRYRGAKGRGPGQPQTY